MMSDAGDPKPPIPPAHPRRASRARMNDADISRADKKLLLFMSTENSLWRMLFGRTVRQKNIAAAFNILESNISNWKRTGKIDHDMINFDHLKLFIHSFNATEDIKSASYNLIDRFLTAFDDESITAYSTGGLLGINLDTSQRILDHTYYSQRPLFPGICYESQRSADEDFWTYRGLYFCWVRRNNVWLQSNLRVRYLHILQNKPAIRCKINFPRIDMPKKKHWEYDGFMAVKNKKLYWMFEKRNNEAKDYFYFVTHSENYASAIDNKETEALTLFGTYLTTGQDTVNSIVSDRIVLQSRGYKDINSIEALMQLEARALSEQEGRRVDDVWNELKRKEATLNVAAAETSPGVKDGGSRHHRAPTRK